MKARSTLVAALGLSVLSSGCISATDHRDDVSAAAEERVTVGVVQREIRVGMSGAEVLEALGSPNVVSTDSERREVWVYDRFATETVRSESSGGVAALVFGGVGGVLGGASASSGAASRSQRLLTVIVKFDEAGAVRDFAYHTSRF
jgi:hypothetical protein